MTTDEGRSRSMTWPHTTGYSIDARPEAYYCTNDDATCPVEEHRRLLTSDVASDPRRG